MQGTTGDSVVKNNLFSSSGSAVLRQLKKDDKKELQILIKIKRPPIPYNTTKQNIQTNQRF